MRKLALSLIVAFAVYVTAAAAQAGGGMGQGSQGTQGQSPSMQQPGAAPGTAQPGAPGQQPDMGPSTSEQNGSTANTSSSKGEKKLKGCVESQAGQYVLETKKGPVSLAGQDVSAHVGHEVTVKGTWENGGSNSSATATSSGSESMSKGTFNVTNVKMDSETCKMKTKDNSSGMGTGSSNGTGSSTGTGASTSGSPSGTGTGNSTGTGSSTTPPQ
jgi:hypothetical protein